MTSSSGEGYHIFGFTGTPVFAINTGTVKNLQLFTTAQTFGDHLYSYTIVDAINDKNVLPFRADYMKTMEENEDIDDEEVWDITARSIFSLPAMMDHNELKNSDRLLMRPVL